MTAKKFKLRNSQVKDGILITVTAEDDQEGVFGLTRDLVKWLVHGLEKVLTKVGHRVKHPPPDIPRPAPAPTPTEVAAFSTPQKENKERHNTDWDLPATSAIASEDTATPAPAYTAIDITAESLSKYRH
jgi:hypothetical protein